MKKRVLIAGAGAGQLGIIDKAREMGLCVVVLDDRPDAPGFSHADLAISADRLNPAALVEAGRRHAVNGIYPGAEDAFEAVAHAALELDLPGVSTETAFRLGNRLALREALRAHGMAEPRFRSATTVAEAEEAARELGLPVLVKPGDGDFQRGIQRVDYIEDISLAFVQAVRHSKSDAVLLEAFMDGEDFSVSGVVFEGRFRLSGIAGKERSEPPYRYATGVFLPPALDAATQNALEQTAARALKAVGYESGCARVDVLVTPGGPRVADISGRAAGSCFPPEFVQQVCGVDLIGDSLRVALGESPGDTPKLARGCAIYWIPSRSGVVTEIVGVEAALGVPGVTDVKVNVEPGNVLGHVVDCASRDRIGYVLATGDTAEEAARSAKTARDLVHILTRPTF